MKINFLNDYSSPAAEDNPHLPDMISSESVAVIIQLDGQASPLANSYRHCGEI